MIAQESEAGAVGRPGRHGFIPFACCEPVQLFGCDVEQVDVAVASGEKISLHVLFEVVAVDHDRLGNFCLAAGAFGFGAAGRVRGFGRGRVGVGIRVADHQRQAL